MPHSVGVIAALSVALAAPLQVVSAEPPLLSTTASATTQPLADMLQQAQAHWNQKNLIAALHSYDHALALDPDNAAALQGRLRVLSVLGLPDEALAEAQKNTVGASNRQTQQTLQEDRAAQAIRWSEQVYYAQPRERYPVCDAAIALVQANLQRYPDSLRSRFDWIRALANRQRHTEAIAAYQKLKAADTEMPAYVHASAGRAYFAEKQPDLAAEAYQKSLAIDADNLDTNFGLFYALSDQGHYGAANQHIQSVAASKLLPEPKFAATSTAIAGQAYAGDLKSAQNGYLHLQQEAPNSTHLRIALGRLYMWRGWPERAQAELELAALREPDDIRAQNALVEVDATQGNYASAAQRLARLEVIAPDDPDVKNLQRAQTVRQYNELSLSVSGTRTKDNAGSSHGTVFDAKLLAKPIALQTRPFVHTYTESSTVDDARAEYQRLGVGVEHRIPAVGVVEVEIQQELNLDKKSSLILGGSWNLNDFWSLDGLLDSNAVDVPLRARVDDISGWKARLGAAYRAHEGAYSRIDYTELQMSDQNQRRSVALSGNYTVLQRPSFKGIVGLEWSASSNSLRNTAYFNPQNDNTAQLAYTTEWLSHHAQSRVLTQQLVLAAGRYAQDGFDAGTIGSISYQHQWKLSDVAQLRYGVAYVRRLYDGLVTDGPEANVSFNWRF